MVLGETGRQVRQDKSLQVINKDFHQLNRPVATASPTGVPHVASRTTNEPVALTIHVFCLVTHMTASGRHVLLELLGPLIYTWASHLRETASEAPIRTTLRSCDVSTF